MDGATPTAFRAREREDLVPTLVQLQRTQSNVSLKWFERNRIWTSPGEAREALLALRQRKRPRDPRPAWRPGGEHRDPRQRFELSRDQKRARFKARQRRPATGGPRHESSPRGRGRPGPRRPPKPRKG
jgi:hypothetical protein